MTCYHLLVVTVATLGRPAPAQLPPPPSDVRVTNGCSSVRLDWSPVLQATNYYIRRNTVSNQTSATTVACGQPNFYVDSAASIGVTYYYWVGSNNGLGTCGNGPPGGVVSGTRLVGPSLPTGVAASTGRCDEVEIRWNPASNATSYSVYRNTSMSSAGALRLGASAASPYSDATAQRSRTYYYWVTAENACGSTPRMGGASGSTATDPAVPGGLRASDGTSCAVVNVTWSPAAYATAYEVFRNTQSSSTGRVRIATLSTTSFADTTASHGRTYFYWVRGTGSCGPGAFGAVAPGYLAPCATVQGFGIGCGSPALAAGPSSGSLPIVGGTFTTDLWNVPGVCVVVLGISDRVLGSVGLPLDLGILGLTGCRLLQSAELGALPCTPTGPGTARHWLPIPEVPTMIGAHLYLQAVAQAPGHNRPGTILSNGVALSLGR